MSSTFHAVRCPKCKADLMVKLMSRLVLLLTILLTVYSCTPRVKYYPEVQAPPYISKNENCLIDVYGLGELAPPAANLVGVLHLDDTGFTVKCGMDYLLRVAKSRACVEGADAIKIMVVKPPDSVYTCYRLKVAFLRYSRDLQTAQEDLTIQESIPAEQVHANCDLKVRDLLNSGEHVALCINMSEPNNTCPFDQDRIENWQKAMTDEVGNFYENVVFSYYNKFENFTLVDRNNLINVLKEHQLSQSGLTNKETRIEVGKLVGINYLVNIGYNRYCILPRVNDITTIKIIEIKTGKIVAVDTITNKQIYNPKSLQLEIIKTILNGQEVVMGSDGRTLYRK